MTSEAAIVRLTCPTRVGQTGVPVSYVGKEGERWGHTSEAHFEYSKLGLH